MEDCCSGLGLVFSVGCWASQRGRLCFTLSAPSCAAQHSWIIHSPCSNQRQLLKTKLVFYHSTAWTIQWQSIALRRLCMGWSLPTPPYLPPLPFSLTWLLATLVPVCPQTVQAHNKHPIELFLLLEHLPHIHTWPTVFVIWASVPCHLCRQTSLIRLLTCFHLLLIVNDCVYCKSVSSMKQGSGGSCSARGTVPDIIATQWVHVEGRVDTLQGLFGELQFN